MKNLQNPKKCNVKLRLFKNQEVFVTLPIGKWGFLLEATYNLHSSYTL